MHFVNRFFDLWISLIALICISPILLVIIIWLYFASKKAGSLTLSPPATEYREEPLSKERGELGKTVVTTCHIYARTTTR